MSDITNSGDYFFSATITNVYGIEYKKAYATPQSLLRRYKDDGLTVADVIRIRQGKTVYLNCYSDFTIVDIIYEKITF